MTDPRFSQLLPLADLCVRCGLCLPHCPTYLDSRQEGDGPRGRIALVQGLLEGSLPRSPALDAHLDGCLSCRACEAVCPARVPFGRLLDGGRAELARGQPRRLHLAHLASAVLTRRRLRDALVFLLWLAQRLRLDRLARAGRLGRRLARLATILPRLSLPRRPSLPTDTAAGDAVQLFGGCVTELAEHPVLRDAAELLGAAGYAVSYPRRQTCCGALLQHAGDLAGAERLAARNVDAFAGSAPIAAITPGCAASLRDYTWLQPERGPALAERVHDVTLLLAVRLDRLRFAPLPVRALLHLPCTLLNALREHRALERLLAAVPELELESLDPAQRCCGAAGLHFVTEPVAADRFLEAKLDAIETARPALILSSNVGCSLHLAAGLRRRGSPVPVVHPLSLLAQQWRRAAGG